MPAKLRHPTAMMDDFVQGGHDPSRTGVRRSQLRQETFGMPRRLAAMMHDGMGIAHTAVGDHLFDVFQQPVALLPQARSRRCVTGGGRSGERRPYRNQRAEDACEQNASVAGPTWIHFVRPSIVRAARSARR